MLVKKLLNMGDKGQTSTEYLLLVAIGFLLAIIAVAGLFHVASLVYEEYNKIHNYQNKVIKVLLS